MIVTRRWQPHLFVCLVTAAVTCIPRLLRKGHYAADFRKAQSLSVKARGDEIEGTWRARDYAETAEAGFAEAFLGRIQWDSLGLDELQRSRLEERLRALLDYFRNPTFEGYCKLKTEGLQYVLEESPRAKAILGPTGGHTAPDAGARLNAFWNWYHGPGGKGQLPKITAVCLDSL